MRTFSFIRNRAFLLPALLVLLALMLRLAGAGFKSLWSDEFYAAGLMNSSIPQLVKASFQGSPHPPLAFVSLRISALLFGTSEAGLRVVPAFLTALATVPLYMFVKRRTGTLPAFMAGLLWAVAPYSVSLGQEAWIYGTLAAFGFTFIWLADMAWRGSTLSSVLLVPLGLCGMLVQHLFAIYLAAGFLLYFTVERKERTDLRRFITVGILILVLYAPFVFPALQQAALRSARIRNATLPGVIVHRLLRRIPTVIARLIPGGVAAELSMWNFSEPVTPSIFLLSFLFAMGPFAYMLVSRGLSLAQKLWAGGLFLLPLLMFVVEDPTARHLSMMWIPLALSVGVIAKRHWLPASVIVVFAAVLLFPYYRIDTFPYHRSDWRQAVETVERNIEPHQEVIILGGQNGGLAWDYYAGDHADRLAVGGESPYDVQPISSRLDPLAKVDSVLATGTAVWVVHDIWGGPTGSEIAPGYPVLFRQNCGPSMEVMLVGSH